MGSGRSTSTRIDFIFLMIISYSREKIKQWKLLEKKKKYPQKVIKLDVDIFA